MIKFKQHLPNWVDFRVERFSGEFQTMQEILNLDIIKCNKERDNFVGYGIYNDNCLMCSYENGESWWVLGYIDSDEPIEFPQMILEGDKAIIK